MKWVGKWASDPGDLALLEYATAGGWVIVTIDKDFGDLLELREAGAGRCGVIRLIGFRAAAQGPALASLVEQYAPELAQGALLTAEPWRVRVRRSG